MIIPNRFRAIISLLNAFEKTFIYEVYAISPLSLLKNYFITCSYSLIHHFDQKTYLILREVSEQKIVLAKKQQPHMCMLSFDKSIAQFDRLSAAIGAVYLRSYAISSFSVIVLLFYLKLLV